MSKEDMEHLEWIYARMKNVHNENPKVDYMVRFKKILTSNPIPKEANGFAFGGYTNDDLKRE